MIYGWYYSIGFDELGSIIQDTIRPGRIVIRSTRCAYSVLRMRWSNKEAWTTCSVRLDAIDTPETMMPWLIHPPMPETIDGMMAH